MLAANRLEEARAVIRPQQVPKPASSVWLRRFLVRLFIGMLLATFAVSRFAITAEDGYHIDRIQSRLRAATAQQVALRSEIASLEAAPRLLALGGKLHLHAAAPALVLQMKQPSTPAPPAAPKATAAHKGRLMAAISALIANMAHQLAHL